MKIEKQKEGAMALLTNQDIEALMQAGQLILYGDQKYISPASYDLGIGTIFRDGQVINAKHPKAGEQIIIKPGEVVTMLTHEHLALPADIAGTAYPMNAQSSEGLLVLNPGHVDPGFHGALTVKAINLRKVPFALSLRDRIFTVVFYALGKDSSPTYPSNSDHDIRERTTNKKDVELSMKSLSQLIALDSPFPTHKEVHEIVTKHWFSWLTFLLTLGGFVFALIAAAAAGFAVMQNMRLAAPATASTEQGSTVSTKPSAPKEASSAVRTTPPQPKTTPKK